MKKLLSAVLILLLAGMPAIAEAQGSEKPAKPPKAAKPPKQAWSDWSKVARIKAGSTINLTVAGNLRVARMFVSAVPGRASARAASDSGGYVNSRAGGERRPL